MATLKRPRGHHLPFPTLPFGFTKGRICGSLSHTRSFIWRLVNILPVDRDLETSPPRGPEGTSTVSQQGGNSALYFLPSVVAITTHSSTLGDSGVPGLHYVITTHPVPQARHCSYPDSSPPLQTADHPLSSGMPLQPAPLFIRQPCHSCCPQVSPELQQHLPRGHVLPPFCPPQSFPKKTSEFSV